jgi:hypothetical protein
MIIDEPVVMAIQPIKVSCGGKFLDADKLVMSPPKPRMAKHVFKMRKYFTSIQKEGLKSLTEMLDQETFKEQVQAKQLQLEAGDKTKAIHEEFADDSPDKEAKLAKIEATIEGLAHMITICEKVDLYQMTYDFGRLLLDNELCKLKGDGDDSPYLNSDIWEGQIQPQDRLDAAVRYCCFFGLTSSMI